MLNPIDGYCLMFHLPCLRHGIEQQSGNGVHTLLLRSHDATQSMQRLEAIPSNSWSASDCLVKEGGLLPLAPMCSCWPLHYHHGPYLTYNDTHVIQADIPPSTARPFRGSQTSPAAGLPTAARGAAASVPYPPLPGPANATG